MNDQTEALILEVAEYLRSIRASIDTGRATVQIRATVKGDRIRVTASVK